MIRYAAHLLLFAIAALPARTLLAERLFVGVVEADSCQSVTLGVSAFSRYADLPSALDFVSSALADALSVPSLSLVAPTERFQIVQTVDLALPRSDNNPANVAIVPLGVTREAFQDAYRAAYGSNRRYGPFTVYEKPSDTNLPAKVAVGLEARHALTSPSVDALQWAWDNRTRLIDAPVQNIPGTLRALVHPPRLADALGSHAEQAAPLLNLDKLIRDFDSLSFAVTFEGQALSATLRGKPAPSSTLSRLAAALYEPSDHLWRTAPDSAFFVSVSANRQPGLWEDYLGDIRINLLRPAAAQIPADAFTGERLLYAAPTASGHGVCVVHVEPVTNATRVAAALTKLDGALIEDGVTLKRGTGRKLQGAAVESYAFAVRPPGAGARAAAEPSVLSTLLSVLLKDAALETTVWNGQLVTVVGTTNALDGVLADLATPRGRLSLRQRISGQDSALAHDLITGTHFLCASLIRHLVAIMPGVQPEHLRVLPSGGDGATFGIAPGKDGELSVSLRIQTNEIAALQRINRDGREVLQELFFQMFSSQLLNLQRATGDPDSGKR